MKIVKTSKIQMNLKASKNNQGSNSKQKHYGESDHFNIKNRKRL